MDPIPLPAPYGGVNQKIPVIALQSPQCENLFNFNVNQAGCQLRNGDSKFSKFTDAATSDIMGIFPFGDSTRLFAPMRQSFSGVIDFYDAESGALVYTSIASVGTTALSSVYFNKYLFFFGNTSTLSPGLAYDGAAFAAAGYTGVNLWPIGGNVFKNRMYMVQLSEAAYWYTDRGAITGACHKVDLSDFTQNKCTLSSICSFTLSEQTTTDIYQAFIFSNGEVNFYSGSYPDSSDWTAIGTSKVAQPLAPGAVIPYQGDTIIITDTGLVSLRDLFLKGSQAATGITFSDQVNTSWNALVKAIRVSLSTPTGPITGGYLVGTIRGIFDAPNNRIIVSLPYYFDSSGVLTKGSYYFVFDNQLNSWYFQRSFGGQIFDIAKYKNKVVMITNLKGVSLDVIIYEKEGSTGFMDRNAIDSADTAYDFEIKSAPVANGRAYVQKGEGLDAIMETDLETTTNYYLIKDLGVGTTTAQLLPDIPSGVQKPTVNMGIEGSYIQYKISGTTAAGKTVGYKLYGTNFWVEMGNSPR